MFVMMIVTRKRRVQDKNIAVPTNKVLLATGSSEMHPNFVDPVDVRRMQYQSPGSYGDDDSDGGVDDDNDADGDDDDGSEDAVTMLLMFACKLQRIVF